MVRALPRLPVPKLLQRRIGRAIADFRMIQPGDRILLGLSGGKDSLTLLHLLRAMQRQSPVPFELGVATVDPMSPDYDPQPLVPYLRELGIPYFLERQNIYERAHKHLLRPSYCSFCARMRRGGYIAVLDAKVIRSWRLVSISTISRKVSSCLCFITVSCAP
ncbi:hypothetical protein AFERRI_400180 [Acidithiobacillus ferrivorans]|uniref:tRNA(Ile)-lysidine/2-thiocytidine synthase N-terminal domain-containing protein n=2 Tax=Acidithiobacillus ferrivorans TaxID=160808 RepID=A0A060UV12_9PROT|nr:hypothetical protein AFERRI_400180 [Acidithiobacillus ferrivorans]